MYVCKSVCNFHHHLGILFINSSKGEGDLVSQIKIISYPNISSVEETLNSWLSNNKANILSTNFSVSSHDGELWYSIVILYEPVNEE